MERGKAARGGRGRGDLNMALVLLFEVPVIVHAHVCMCCVERALGGFWLVVVGVVGDGQWANE